MINEAISSEEFWTNHFAQMTELYPAELLVRIFKGNYPKLKLNKNFSNQSVADLGCGSGKNIQLLSDLKFKEIYGIDISDELVLSLQMKFKGKKNVQFLKGTNDNIPLPDDSLDYLISWGSSYCISEKLLDDVSSSYTKHLKEFSRVLKKNGTLIIDLPHYHSDIYDNSKEIAPGYIYI